jgi:hypothetical protein
MYLLVDPVENPLRICPIQMGRKFPFEPYPSRQLGCIDDSDLDPEARSRTNANTTCYDVNSAKAFNQLSTTDEQRCTLIVYLLRLQTIQAEPIICPVSQQVYHLREMHFRRVCRSIKLTPLRDGSEDFGIPNFGLLFHAQIEEN